MPGHRWHVCLEVAHGPLAGTCYVKISAAVCGHKCHTAGRDCGNTESVRARRRIRIGIVTDRKEAIGQIDARDNSFGREYAD